jgi:hypothetical protein
LPDYFKPNTSPCYMKSEQKDLFFALWQFCGVTGMGQAVG